MSAGPGNRVIAKQIFAALQIPVQFGGGLRAMSDLDDVLEAGAARAVLGTAAVQDPEFLAKALERFGERIVVGIDARDGHVATHGWNKVGSLEAEVFAAKLVRNGVQRVVHTDISKDGMLMGPNLEASRRLAASSGLKVIVSGGVASLGDLQSLRGLESSGVEGAIVGKALYEGRLTLKEAMEAAGAATATSSELAR